MGVSKEILIEMYRKMLLSRRVEEKIIDLYRVGLAGPYHLSIGQEAVAVGVCTALKKEDYILSTHRGKGHYVSKGGDIRILYAELMGKQTGSNKGKGGSMHVIDKSVGMLGANGIVGSSLPIACGVALYCKMSNNSRVTAGFFGDGAANSGPCHESLNIAALWKLPVIFVCENNYYQVSVPLSSHSSIENLYTRASSYGIPGIAVDGMNVTEVYREAMEAVQRARNDEGPSLIECRTYRFRGHHEGDPTCGLSYRSKKEINSWKKKCPIVKLRDLLLAKNWITKTELDSIDYLCKKQIEEAVEFAKNSPIAPQEWALTDVYA